MRDHTFTMTGGSVTSAALVEGETAKWTVTVALPATTDSTADGVLCTEDGRKLLSTVSATVTSTAAFRPDVPCGLPAWRVPLPDDP